MTLTYTEYHSVTRFEGLKKIEKHVLSSV